MSNEKVIVQSKTFPYFKKYNCRLVKLRDLEFLNLIKVE